CTQNSQSSREVSHIEEYEEVSDASNENRNETALIPNSSDLTIRPSYIMPSFTPWGADGIDPGGAWPDDLNLGFNFDSVANLDHIMNEATALPFQNPPTLLFNPHKARRREDHPQTEDLLIFYLLYRWQTERFVVLKLGCHGSGQEYDIEDHIAKKNPSHQGYGILRTCLEHFEITGPEGKHLYLKLENMLVTVDDKYLVRDFLEAQSKLSIHYKIDSAGRHVYRRQNNFGPIRKLANIIPMIADFGNAEQLEPGYQGVYPIQADHYRAPEVILGYGWSSSTDIWNLGVLVWDMVEGTELFRRVYDARGRYDSKAHVAEMIALLGPVPKELLARSKTLKAHDWPDRIFNERGKLCRSAEDFFGGPFFNEEGEFLYKGLIPDRSFKDTLPSVEEKEREDLLSFMSGMLTWHPDERKTARELAEHPFLSSKENEKN
ncbi:hypothetical protein FQN54_003757, partial [Arachnomyces sp. PD_36]